MQAAHQMPEGEESLASDLGPVGLSGWARLHSDITSLLTVTLFVPVLGALFVRGAGRAEGLASVLAGVPTLLAVQTLTAGAGVAGLPPTTAGLAASAVAYATVRALRRA